MGNLGHDGSFLFQWILTQSRDTHTHTHIYIYFTVLEESNAMRIKWLYSLRLIMYFTEVENIENLKFIVHSCTDEVPPGEWEWKRRQVVETMR